MNRLELNGERSDHEVNLKKEKLPSSDAVTISEQLMSPQYRFAVSERLKSATGATDVLLFDHISPYDPSLGKGIKTSLGYEKCLVSAIPLTKSMRTHVLLQTPPLPAEMAMVSDLHTTVPDAKKLHVWVPDPTQTDRFLDGFKLYHDDPDAYTRLVASAIVTPPEGSSTFHVNATPGLLEAKDFGKTLILPFQTMNWHRDKFAELIEADKVVLPDSADTWINKGEAHEYFEKHGTGDLRPESTHISMGDIREPTDDNIATSARRVEVVCRAMINEGKIPFVKLAGNGLAGFGIVNTTDNPLLDPDIPEDEKSKAFKDTVRSIFSGTHNIADAVVEEFIDVDIDNEGKKEYILSGIMVDGELYPWSVSRSITDDKGVYLGVITSPDPADIGLTEESIKQAIGEGARMADAMVKGGYSTGYVAKDFMVSTGEDGTESHMYHDDNDRRGGRTIADHLSALTGRGYCDRSYTITVPPGNDIAEHIIGTTEKLKEAGLSVYGTGSVYTGGDTIVLRVLSPLDILKQVRAEKGIQVPLAEVALDYVNAMINPEEDETIERTVFQPGN